MWHMSLKYKHPCWVCVTNHFCHHFCDGNQDSMPRVLCLQAKSRTSWFPPRCFSWVSLSWVVLLEMWFSLIVSTMLLSMPLSHWRTNVSCLILPHYPTLSVFWSGRGFPRSGFTVRFRPLCTLHTNMEWIIRLGIVRCLSERKLQLIFEVNLPKNNPLGLISEAGVREI